MPDERAVGSRPQQAHPEGERLAAYEAAAAEGAADPFGRATLEFGLRYERAVLGWFDALPAILPTDGGRAGDAVGNRPSPGLR